MMEKLGEPQTHLALKEMIRTIDEDRDDQISFREVYITFSINMHVYIVVLVLCTPLYELS